MLTVKILQKFVHWADMSSLSSLKNQIIDEKVADAEILYVKNHTK